MTNICVKLINFKNHYPLSPPSPPRSPPLSPNLKPKPPCCSPPMQAGSSQATSPGLSVVKVLSSSEVAALSGPGSRGASEESRKLEHQKKQEKANRIVAEAIARARARGEQNIPRVLNEDELPSVRPDDEGERKRRRKGAAERGGPKEERPRKGKGQGGAGKSKGRSKPR